MCMGEKSVATVLQRGEVVFKLVVSPEGSVTEIQILKGKDSDEILNRCIMEKLKALMFPKGNRKAEITVAFTIT